MTIGMASWDDLYMAHSNMGSEAANEYRTLRVNIEAYNLIVREISDVSQNWPFMPSSEQKKLVHHRLTSQLRVLRQALSIERNPNLYQEILHGLPVQDIQWPPAGAHEGQPIESPNLDNEENDPQPNVAPAAAPPEANHRADSAGSAN